MCTESQQLNSSMQDDPTDEMQNKQVKENNAERKRAMAKERSRRFREKKRLNVLKIQKFKYSVVLSTHSFFNWHYPNKEYEEDGRVFVSEGMRMVEVVVTNVWDGS